MWIPIALPLGSWITGEPELPPVVSVAYCTVLPLNVTHGPTCVSCTWFHWAGELRVP